jgi:hypothetical protein
MFPLIHSSTSHSRYAPLTYSTSQWYAFHSHLTNYQWTGGFVAGDEIIKEAEFFKSSGLYAAGYQNMNFDDCIVVGRDPTS